MGEGHTHNTHKNTTIQNAQMSNGGYTTTRFRNQMENISCDIYITYPNEPLAIISIGFGGSGSSGGFLSYRPFAHTLKNSSGIPVEVQICQKVLYKGWPYANLCNKE